MTPEDRFESLSDEDSGSLGIVYKSYVELSKLLVREHNRIAFNAGLYDML